MSTYIVFPSTSFKHLQNKTPSVKKNHQKQEKWFNFFSSKPQKIKIKTPERQNMKRYNQVNI